MGLLIVIAAVALFAPSGIGRLVNFGKTHTDEFCKECGAFRRADYLTLFVQSFETKSELYTENGIQKLHDAFFTPCRDHKWCIFHLGRGCVEFKGYSEPYPKIGFEILKHFENKKMQDFMSAKPSLASQTASILFDFAKQGNNGRLLSDLSMAIDMDDDAEISATLAGMAAELGRTIK